MQPIALIDRGRGPEIAGTRITVFDLLPYLKMGWHPSSIGLLFNLSPEEVQTALHYYQEHEAEVTAINRTSADQSAIKESKRHTPGTKVLALRVQLQTSPATR